MDPGTTSVIFFPTNFSKPLATRTDVTAVLVRTMSSVCQRSMLRGEPTVWSAYVCQRPVQHALDFTIFAAIATPSLQLARERRDYVPLHFSQARCPTDKSKPRYLRPIFQNVSHEHHHHPTLLTYSCSYASSYGVWRPSGEGVGGTSRRCAPQRGKGIVGYQCLCCSTHGLSLH